MRDLRELWNFNDPKGTEERFRAWLPESGEQHDEVISQIARCLGLQGKFDEAEELLNTILDDWENAGERAKVSYFLEQGRLLNSSGDPKSAKPLFLNALEHAVTETDLKIDALHMLGIVDSPNEALKWNFQAIELAKTTSRPSGKRWLGSLLNNTAWTLHDTGRAKEALPLFEEAVKFREAQGDPAPILTAKYAVARCKRTLGEYETALKELFAIRGDGNDPYIEEEIGENLWALDKLEEAIPYLDRASQMFEADSYFMKVESQRLDSIKNRIRKFR